MYAWEHGAVKGITEAGAHAPNISLPLPRSPRLATRASIDTATQELPANSTGIQKIALPALCYSSNKPPSNADQRPAYS